MGNKTSLVSQGSIFTTIQQELEFVRHQLANACKTLAEKDQMIGSLEDDLAHMVEVLSNRSHSQQQWMGRGVPGLAEA